MSTTMLTKETVERKWYILDAAGKPLGKTAAAAADLLRGKLKTDYTPHVDCGDYVIIINAKDAVLTGKKLEQKYYRTHSGWVGGLKETQYKHLMEKRPRAGYAHRSPRHAPEEHHCTVAAQAPESFRRSRA